MVSRTRILVPFLIVPGWLGGCSATALPEEPAASTGAAVASSPVDDIVHAGAVSPPAASIREWSGDWAGVCFKTKEVRGTLVVQLPSLIPATGEFGGLVIVSFIPEPQSFFGHSFEEPRQRPSYPLSLVLALQSDGSIAGTGFEGRSAWAHLRQGFRSATASAPGPQTITCKGIPNPDGLDITGSFVAESPHCEGTFQIWKR